MMRLRTHLYSVWGERTAWCDPESQQKYNTPTHAAQVRVKCNEDDTIGDLKKLIAAQVGTRPEKIRIQKWYTVYKVGCESIAEQRYLASVSTNGDQLGLPRNVEYWGRRKNPPRQSSNALYLSDVFFFPCFFSTAWQDHITLEDYEIHDGMGLEMYYN